ncbi:Thiamin biosynthesis lipoprotein ApbE [Cystobacter fuscus DSM 2262]|uniref:FAD:protein FMN transferase n=1 Tax=Cystobacter fuscus (strain ATCC 25194 / DSM 2262 / NBRC 100088 / M29) TaxID=1242864 RepID=S9QK23_CYSF2|nr:FAD:protein FMN transferase [Cystobacter fuscus]EPX56843.1 Thiamin biosynthesis lipoprotein ApbE [Cystobacter fuscus DSM 2262]
MGQNGAMVLPALLVMLAATPEPRVRTETRPMMGTHVTVTLVGGTSRKAREGFDGAFAAFTRVNEVMNEWRPDSALSEVNRRAGDGSFVPVPEDLCAALRRAVRGAEQTGGLFDPTWAALRGLWRFGTELTPTLPDPAELKNRCALISYRGLEFAPEADGGGAGCGVRLARAGMQLGLGGLAKGWGVDQAVEKLRALGFRDFFVQAGGDFYAAGKKAGRPWKVGIREPRGEPGRVFAVLEVSDAAFSTSGDYENFFLLDGKRYHHIINPRTCYPAMASRSATILAPSAVDAEVLTKSVFILGGEAGLALAQKHGASAVVVTAEGEVLTSPGLRGKLRLTRGSEEPPR